MPRGKKGTAKKAAKKQPAKKVVPLRVNQEELFVLCDSLDDRLDAINDTMDWESPDQLEQLAGYLRLRERAQQLYQRHFGSLNALPRPDEEI